VLKRLAEGKVYKQIALDLGLSTSTVRTHLHNIYGKLGASTAHRPSSWPPSRLDLEVPALSGSSHTIV